MSNRSLLEFNHDFCPQDKDAALLDFARSLRDYMCSGDKQFLPTGVTFINMRHHTAPSPLWPAWFDVKDQLPPFAMKILVAHKIYGTIQAERQPYSSTNWKNWVWHAANGTLLNQADVSYWCQLPEPPEK